jgi:hypothetical protein
VLRRIFSSKRDEGTEDWRNQHSEEPGDINSRPNIVRIIKSIREYCASHVERMGGG